MRFHEFLTKIFLAFLVIPMVSFCFGGDIHAIQDFGAHGDKVPTFLGTGPNPSFFTRPMTKSFATRSEYTAMYDLARAKTPGDTEFQGESLNLTLMNMSDVRGSIVVSAAKGAEVQNHLIRIEPGEWQTLDIRDLFSHETLYLVSIQDFEGLLEMDDGEGSIQDPIVPNPPIRELNLKNIPNYCQEIKLRSNLLLRIQVASNSASEDAWFERKFWGYGFPCPYYQNPPIYIMNVYWPTKGILHHDGYTHQQDSCLQGLPCVKERYSTTSPVSGNILRWINYNFWANIPGTGGTIQATFDEVLFESGCGVVVCQLTSQGGTGSICTVDPNFIWYVYNPVSSSCP